MSEAGYQPSQIKRLIASWPVTYIRPGMMSLGAVSNTFFVWLPLAPRSPSGKEQP